MTRQGIILLTAFILRGLSPMTAIGDTLRGESLLTIDGRRNSPIGRSVTRYYTAGPSTMTFADSASISSVGFAADYAGFDRAVVVQEGTGELIFSLEAESYYKLSGRSTVWGNAAYHTGTIRDVRFCDVTDYVTVAPFVLMDDAGGDLRCQRYDFGGGWNGVYGSWTVGAQAAYRATIAHREVDPRVRNILSDLNVSVGGARMLGSRYMMGLDLGVRIYHQDTDVDFYNPVSHAITMVYTGLGSSSTRFRGADVQSGSHSLTGICCSLRLLPRERTDGYYVKIDGGISGASLILDGYNNLEFGTTSTRILSAMLSRRLTLSPRITMFPTLSAGIMSRVAAENLFGSSADNYVKIGERSNYHHTRPEAHLDLPAAIDFPRYGTTLTVRVTPGYVTEKEYLAEPDRSLTTQCIEAGALFDVTKRFGSHLAAGATVEYAGRFVTSTSAVWGGLDLTSPEGAMCLSDYRMSSCDLSATRLRFYLTRAFTSFALRLSADYTRYEYHHLNKGNSVTAVLSLIF